MCCEQDDWWKTIHHHLDCGKITTFTREKVSSRWDDWVDKEPVQPRYENLHRKEAWLPWNNAWIISKETGRTENCGWPKGGNIRFWGSVNTHQNCCITSSGEPLRHQKGKQPEETWWEMGHGIYHAVNQLIFACPMGRKDVQTTVSFLNKRLQIPDRNDWGKIKRVLQFVHQTNNLPLIRREDIIPVIKWWVYASCAAHLDMRGHTGSLCQ